MLNNTELIPLNKKRGNERNNVVIPVPPYNEVKDNDQKLNNEKNDNKEVDDQNPIIISDKENDITTSFFSHDGVSIILCSENQLKSYEIECKNTKKSSNHIILPEKLLSVKIHPLKNEIVMIFEDSIAFAELNEGKQIIENKVIHKMNFVNQKFRKTQIEFSPKGSFLGIMVGLSIKIWNYELKKIIYDIEMKKEAQNLILHLDEMNESEKEECYSAFLTSESEELFQIMKIAFLGEKKYELELFDKSHTNHVNAFSRSKDGDILASASSNKDILIWNAKTMKLQKELLVYQKELKHRNYATSLAFNPKGDLLVAATKFNQIFIWDLFYCSELKMIEVDENVKHVHFDMMGNYLAASNSKKICIWKALPLVQEKFSIFGHKRPVSAADFSKDGRNLATVGYDGNLNFRNFTNMSFSKQIQIFDEKTINDIAKFLLYNPKNINEIIIVGGTFLKLCRILEETLIEFKDDKGKFPIQDNIISNVALSKESDLLYTFSSDRQVRVWKLSEGSLFQGPYPLPDINCLDFHPMDPRKIICYDTKNEQAKIMNYVDNSISISLKEFVGKIMRFSTNGDYAAYSYKNEKTIAILKLEKDEEKLIHNLAHDKNAKCIVFSRDDSKCAVEVENSIRLWSINQSEQATFIDVETPEIAFILFSLDDSQLFVSSLHKSILNIYDCKDGRLIRILSGHKSFVNFIKITPNGKEIISGGTDKTVRIWSAKDGSEKKMKLFEIIISTLTYQLKDDMITCIFAGGCRNKKDDAGIFYKWDLSDGSKKEVKAHEKSVDFLVLSPDEDFLASGSHDETVKIWDIKTLTEIHIIQPLMIQINFNHYCRSLIWRKRDIKNMLFFSCGKMIYCHKLEITLNKSAVFIEDEMQLTFIGHTKDIYSICLSNDSLRLASCSGDCSIRVWSTLSGRQILLLKGHKKNIYCVQFSPCGKWLASGSEDKLIIIWDSISGMIINVLKGHFAGITYLDFHPFENELISVSTDGSIRLWNYQNKSLQLCLKFVIEKEKNTDLCNFQELSPNHDGKSSILHQLVEGKKTKSLLSLLEQFLKGKRNLNYFLLDNENNTAIWKILKTDLKLNDLQLKQFLSFYSQSNIPIGSFQETGYFFYYLIENKRFLEEASQILKNRFIIVDIPCFFFVPWTSNSDFLTTSINYKYDQLPTYFDEDDFTSEPRIWKLIKDYFGTKKQKLQIKKQKFSDNQIKMLDIPNIIKISEDREDFLFAISALDVSHTLFQNPIVEYLVEFKWQKYGKDYFVKQLLIFLVLLILFMINSSYFLPSFLDAPISQNSSERNSLTIMTSFIFAYSIFLIFQELYDLHILGKTRYFKNIFNSFDITYLSLYISCCIFDFILVSQPYHDLSNEKAIKILHSLSFLVSWFKLLEYLKGYEQTAVLVASIIEIMKNIFFFIILLFLILIGFTFAIFILPRSMNLNIYEIFQSFYKLLLGDFSLFDSFYDGSQMDILIWIIFLISSLLLMIILLNILIAILNDAYITMMTKVKQILIGHKIMYLVEYERTMGKKTKQAINNSINDYLLVVLKNSSNFNANINEVEINSKKVEIGGEINQRLDSIELNLRSLLDSIEKIKK